MRKANFFKKLTAGALALTSALSIGFIAGCSCKDEELTEEEKEAKAQQEFINEIGGTSETYKGAVSNANYASAPAAAEAFVKEEIVGNKDVQVVGVPTKKSDLNQTQIAELNIETEETILGVEEYEVEYIENQEVSLTAVQQNSTKKVKVYIIKFESRWEYYTPCPITGETITKSYYDSVFNYEAYKNCTVSMTMDMDISMNMAISYGGQTQNQKVNATSVTTQTVKFSENAIYLEQISKTTSEGQTSESAIYAYLELVENNIVCYVKTTGVIGNINWTQGDLTTIGFGDLEELTPFYDNYLDYSYFTKTSTGFELAEENADKYVEQTLMQELEEMDLSTFFAQMGMDIDMFAKYYVSNGVLSGMREDITLTMSMKESGASMDMNITAVANTKVTNYGTTVVTKPAEIVDSGNNSGSAIG